MSANQILSSFVVDPPAHIRAEILEAIEQGRVLISPYGPVLHVLDRNDQILDSFHDRRRYDA